MTIPYLPYAITEVYCIIFASTILLRLNRNIGSEHQVRQLRNMIFAYFGMLSTDVLWALHGGGIIHMALPVNVVVNGITISCVSLGCYFWFKFVDDRLHPARISSPRRNFLLFLPMLAVLLLDFVSMFTGWVYYIDDAGHYQSTDLFWLQTAVNYFYLVIPTVTSAVMAVRTRSRTERSEYLTYTTYMIAPLTAGMLEDTVPDTPILALNIFLIIHILFLMIQNNQIYNDALTDLNNRRRLNQFLESRLPKATAERPVVLLILDINGFKSINDTYGHIEGDCALRAFADVLKKAAVHCGAFLARYGGDEFCLVSDAPSCTPQDMVESIQGMLHAAGQRTALLGGTYDLTASIGYAVCSAPEYSAEAALRRADAMLYEQKKNWHAAAL